MKVFRTVLLLVLLIGSAHKSPAPVIEEATPAAQPTAKPKKAAQHASVEKTAPKKSGGFDGVWIGKWSGNAANDNHPMIRNNRLTISGGKAAVAEEWTESLAPNVTSWSNIPEPNNTARTIWYTISYKSTGLRADGSNLKVEWAPPELTNWSPKSIPRDSLAKLVLAAPTKVSVYTLKGDRLTRDFDSNGGIVYTRAK